MALSASQVPLQPRNQRLGIDVGLASYRLRTVYDSAPEGGWLLDIADADEAPILCGLAMLPGQDLLAQYGYLALGFGLLLVNTRDPDAAPRFDELGLTANLYVLQTS